MHFIKLAMQAKEEVLKNVLRQLLQREVVPEDARDLTLVSQIDKHDIELLVYKGQTIGALINNVGNPHAKTLTFDFRPDIKTF